MSEITIIIPTYQRPKHILRKLTHFSLAKCDIPIRIYDTSDEEIYQQNKKTVLSFSKTLDIILHRLDTSTRADGSRYFGYSQKLFHAVSTTTTPYTVIHPDDDFLNIKAVKQCLGFLKHNPEYIYATGITLGYEAPELGLDCSHAIAVVHKNDIHDDNNVFTRIERCRASLRNKIVWHNVWRREKFKRVIEPITKYPYEKYTEYMLGFISEAAGKGKLLDVLYELRVPVPQKAIRRKTSIPGFEDHYSKALMDDNFAKDFKAFLNESWNFIKEQEPQALEDESKTIIANAYFFRYLKVQKLFSSEKTICKTIKESWLYRRIKLLLTCPARLICLTSFRRVSLFLQLLKLYGFSTTGHMLRYDKNFEYNIITLLSGESKDSTEFKHMHRSIIQHPEHSE